MKYFIMLLFAMFFLSCDSEDTNPVDPDGEHIADVIMPLKVGYNWIYDVEETDRSNPKVNYTDTLRILKRVKGKEIDLIRSWEEFDETDVYYISSFLVKDTVIYFNKQGGEYRHFFEVIIKDQTPDSFLYGLNSPTNSYDSPRGAIFFYPVVETSIKIETPVYIDVSIKQNRDITVPAGIFKCISYEYKTKPDKSGNYNYHLIYMSPRVGLVKYQKHRFDKTSGSDTIFYTKELVSKNF